MREGGREGEIEKDGEEGYKAKPGTNKSCSGDGFSNSNSVYKKMSVP
jgi:hypothetical protein